jgi:octaprenyl-diphosphate synthase
MMGDAVSAPLVAAARADEREKAERLLEPIAPLLAQTEELIHARLVSDVPFVANAGEYLFAAGGKRMRPAMLLLAARALGRDGDEAVTYAAVTELIHAATLVHDDIIDHAPLRRGRSAVHAVWGSDLTVLLGDWLYTTAMRMALEHGNVEVIDLFCGATLRMTEGELMVLDRLGAIDLTEREYLEIVDRKTAALFAAACSAPALIRPARPEATAALAEFGRALGLCFQLVDDLLDFTAEVERLGKPVLSDLREGKLTLPLLLALPRLGAADRAKIEAVLEDREFKRVAAAEIVELVRREGTLDETAEAARQWGERALGALSSLPDGDARRALELAPSYVLRRLS